MNIIRFYKNMAGRYFPPHLRPSSSKLISGFEGFISSYFGFSSEDTQPKQIHGLVVWFCEKKKAYSLSVLKAAAFWSPIGVSKCILILCYGCAIPLETFFVLVVTWVVIHHFSYYFYSVTLWTFEQVRNTSLLWLLSIMKKPFLLEFLPEKSVSRQRFSQYLRFSSFL